MSVFKAFFKIVKKNRWSFILAVIINIGVTFIYYQADTTKADNDFQATKNNIAVFNHDQGDSGQALVNYLAEKNTIIDLAPTEVAQQDALFFKEVLYIVTIPENYSADLITGKQPLLPTKSVPNSQAEYEVTTLIDEFSSKVVFYSNYFPEKSQTEVLAMVTNNLALKPEITFKSNFEETNKGIVANVFNLLAYGLFSSILSSIGFASISLNRPDLKKRNNSSPLSKRKLNLYFSLAVSLFSCLSWLIFVGISISLSKSTLSQPTTQLLLVNSFIFLLAMISLAIMISYFVTNSEMITGINNVLVLGTCFISGAFVPQEFLSDFVLKLSSFFPTYWFITNNHLIARLETFSFKTLKDVYFNWAILLLFTLAFTIIGFIIRRERGGLTQRFLN